MSTITSGIVHMLQTGRDVNSIIYIYIYIYICYIIIHYIILHRSSAQCHVYVVKFQNIPSD